MLMELSEKLKMMNIKTTKKVHKRLNRLHKKLIAAFDTNQLPMLLL